MKMMVIGHRDAVLGFSLAGVPGRIAVTAQEVNAALDEALAARNVGLVLVTNDVAELVEGRMNQLKLRDSVPLFVEIPGPAGTRPDHPSINEVIRRAIGVRI